MILVSVANFSTHEKPWVRAMSRRVLRAVLNDPVSSLDNGVHPAAGPVGEYAVSQLRKCSGVVDSLDVCVGNCFVQHSHLKEICFSCFCSCCMLHISFKFCWYEVEEFGFLEGQGEEKLVFVRFLCFCDLA